MLWWEEEYYRNKNAEIYEDVLLVAKQFMVFAHIRCPKPPVRYARGLLQSTIRMENKSYLGMAQVVCYCGNETNAYYMPYTNERWISPKWKGAKNPNEDWWDEAIHDVCDVSLNSGASMKGVHADG